MPTVDTIVATLTPDEDVPAGRGFVFAGGRFGIAMADVEADTPGPFLTTPVDGSGATTFAELTDAATVDLPTINGPLADALAAAAAGGGPAAAFNASHIMTTADSFVETTLDLSGDAALRSFYAMNWVVGNDLLTVLDLSESGVEIVRLEGFSVLTSLDVNGCASLRSIGIDAPAIVSLIAAGCELLASLEFLSPPDALATLDLSGCAVLGTIDTFSAPLETVTLAGCSSLTSAALSNSGSLASLDVANCASLASLNATSGMLTSLDISDCVSLTNLNLNTQALTEASVDTILSVLDSNGLEDGNVELSGGTTAPPSVAGLISKTSLEGKGWTVTVNT